MKQYEYEHEYIYNSLSIYLSIYLSMYIYLCISIYLYLSITDIELSCHSMVFFFQMKLVLQRNVSMANEKIQHIKL